MPVVPEPYAPAAAGCGISQDELLAHLSGMHERRLLRRVAAILYHRRAGFSANGMGVWKVPDERIMELGRRMARSAGSRTAINARPTPTGRIRCSRWPTGAPRRSVTRSSTRSPSRPGSTSARRCTPRPSSRRSDSCTSPMSYRDWEREHAGDLREHRGITRSAALFERAQALLPGGVNSPVRAMRPIGRDPIFIASGSGSRISDVDGNTYIDWVCSWGPLILGTPTRRCSRRSPTRAARGQHLRRPDRGRGGAREEVARGCHRSRWCG